MEALHPVTARSASGLDVFSDPASVAVVGASGDRAKWGYWLACGALRGAHRRRVHLVNSRSPEVLGQPCATRLLDLPEAPDLVALCVPAARVPAVVADGLALGVRGFLGITAGVAEEPALSRKITDAGARLIGTNSLGIYDASTDLQLMWGTLTPGPLAIVSQSGQLASEVADLAARHGIGVSRFVSVGNQSDVTAAELLIELAEHDATRAVAVYLESFADGTAVFDALATLAAFGKPTVLLTVGASNAGVRLARSHTGSLTSSVDVVDAACRKAGVVRAGTPGDAVDILRMYLSAPRPTGRRVAIIGDSGGQSGIAADVATGFGLVVPQFSSTLTDILRCRLPDGAASANPVDLAGAGEQDLGSYADVVETVVAAGEVDAVVMTGYLGCYGRDVPAHVDAEAAVVARLGRLAESTGVPVVVHTMGADTLAAQTMADNGIPAYGRIECALRAVSATAARPRPFADPRNPKTAIAVAVPDPGYWAAREMLSANGVAFPAAAVVRTSAEAEAVARALTPPFVLKAGWLDHKSELGGVVVGLADTGVLVAAFEDMHARLGDGDYVVEEQDTRPNTVEILVGGRRDPGFGGIVVVAAGGTETELRQDIRTEIAPVSQATALAMLEELRCAPLLTGWRGRPPVDLDGLAALAVTVSEVIAGCPDIDEIELNPVRVAPGGALAVDALVIRAKAGHDTRPTNLHRQESNR